MGPDIERDDRRRDPWVDRLSEYLDGDLTQSDRAALETHLTSCTACAGTLDSLRAVVSRAHALENAPPAEDLWPGIASQIASAEAAFPERRAREPRPTNDRMWWARRFDLGVPQLAAAGVLLIALSACAVWLVVRGPEPTSAPARDTTAPPRATAAAPGTPAALPGSVAEPVSEPTRDAGIRAAAVPAIAGNPRYDASIAALEQALAEGRGRLDPKTLRIIERNLRVIDRALDEAREAVAADPNNTWLQSHLAATMKRKVDLLRTATLLTAAQG